MRGKKNKNSWVMSMPNESTYQVNGVTYIVASQFETRGEDAIREIMSEEKANQRERIVIYMDDIKQYYPRNMLPKDIVADIKGLLHKRHLEQMRRNENRDAR